MFVYKLVCSETNKVYYGATSHTIKHRKDKGHYHCSCRDFINPTISIVEKCNSIEEMYERELYYIKNFECVNRLGKGISEQTKINKKISCINFKNKVRDEKRHYCKLCDIAFDTPKKLQRHIDGYRHQLKQKSFDKYGESWKEHYLKDNQERYKQSKLSLP